MIGTRMDSENTEIFDSEPGEVVLLLGLIETLIQDWYVGRQERLKRLDAIRQIAVTGAETEQTAAGDGAEEAAAGA